ncbi:MAG: DUF2764 family protein [Mangrovibacterium sp.]
MAKNYYYLVAGLPDILLGDKRKGFGSVELLNSLREELNTSDYALARSLYLPFDHTNFLNKKYTSKASFDERGVYSEEEIEKLLSKRTIESIEGQEFPNYLLRLAEKIDDHEELSRSEAEVELTTAYYDYLLSFKNKFLSHYVAFERNMKNVFIALNGRKYDIDVSHEFVDGDEILADALRKSRARDFGLLGEIDRLEEMLKLFDNPNLQERGFKIDQLKWDYIEELNFFNYFTVEKLLGFIYKLLLVERWMDLSPEEGKKLFERLLQELDSKYEFPEEFKLGNGKK